MIDRAAILGDGRTLEIADALGVSPLPQVRPAVTEAALPVNASRTAPLDDAIRRHIEAALQRTAGRVEGPYGAAKLLDINPHTLRSKMRKLKIDWKRFHAHEGK